MNETDPDNSPEELWHSIRSIPKPESYWHGRRLEEGLAPDNILLFPHVPDAVPANENYGTFHSRFVLDLLLFGEALLHVGGSDYHLCTGESLLIFPHQFHLVRNTLPASTRSQSRWAVATFELRHPEPLHALKNSPRRMRATDRGHAAELFRSYHRGASGIEIAYHLSRLLQGLMEAPSIASERQHLPSPEPERDQFLASVKRHLEHHFTQGALAKAMGVSESDLKSLFRLHVGQTPGDYIRRSRLSHAALLLRKGEGNVGEISDRLGFSSVNAFSRMFKTVYGLPPKQYEKLTRPTTPRQPSSTIP